MSSIKIIALGGVRENGKSLYAVEVEEDIFVLDCGLVYPEDELLGIDVVILTHGHADAVGALPYFLQNIDAPVFGSKLTIALAKYYVESSKLVKGFNDYHEVTENTEIDFASATIKFFKTTHTIPDSLAIVIKTSEGNIVYTGDFKFDQSASVEYQTNFGRITDVGEDYVLALLSDSSDAESPVENVSDRKIAEAMLETFLNAQGRIVVACVASNILRIQQVINAAYESGRKIFLTGSELEEIVNIALSLNKLTVPDKELIISFIK